LRKIGIFPSTDYEYPESIVPKSEDDDNWHDKTGVILAIYISGTESSHNAPESSILYAQTYKLKFLFSLETEISYSHIKTAYV